MTGQLVNRRPLLLVVAMAIVGTCSLHAAEPKTKHVMRTVKAMVTDREDQPIEGATVVKLDWFEFDDPEVPQTLTDAEGEFEFAIEESDGKRISNYVVIHKEGRVRQMPPLSAKATSGKEGRFVVKVEPGMWHVSITKAPDGYCKTLTSDNQIVVPEQGEHRLPEVRVPKGKTIKGTIEGVDLSIRRARWIHVSWSEPDGESGKIYGQFRGDGTFAVKIPKQSTADTFEIVAIEGGSDVLDVRSKDPLVLTSVKD